jgi:tetratricopeptide (TPR) repeat protein
VLRWQGDAHRSRSLLEEAERHYRELGDRWNLARTLYRLGQYLADLEGDLGGRAMLEESSAILEDLGEAFIYVGVLGTRGVIAVNTGEYASARSYFERGLSLAHELGDPWGAADALTNIGCIVRIQGDYAAARSYLEEALSLYQRWGKGTWCADALCALAENEIAQGNLSGALISTASLSQLGVIRQPLAADPCGLLRRLAVVLPGRHIARHRAAARDGSACPRRPLLSGSCPVTCQPGSCASRSR